MFARSCAGTARISSIHYNGAGEMLKTLEGIQDNAFIVNMFVPSVGAGNLQYVSPSIYFMLLDRAQI
jgi:hypothetical protein